MIYGIGMDLCAVRRMEMLSNKDAFLNKYFSKKEQEYIVEKGASSDQTMAGMFAAKEAFVKMLGTGFENADLKAIEVLHGDHGEPYYNPKRWAEKALEQRGIASVFLSISHEKEMAGAYAVAETGDAPI